VQEVKFEAKYKIYKDCSSFDVLTKSLLDLAIETSKKAYAPYSDFGVGSSVLLENEVLCEGNNQENGAFPSGLCAERVAIFHASAKHPKKRIIAVAVTIDYNRTDFTEMAFPCGSCRQSMLEYELKQKENIKLYVIGRKKEVLVSESIAQLLPFCFKGDFLQNP